MVQSLKAAFRAQVEEQFLRQPAGGDEILSQKDVDRLPEPVQRYLVFVGAVGRPRIRNFHLEFDVEMKRSPTGKPMIGTSEQFNFMANPARIFYMKARLFGIPLDGLHSYQEQKASMIIRAASLFNVVNLAGPELDETETVTLLNDLCLIAPSELVDSRISYQPISGAATGITFRNGPHQVSGVLHFGGDGQLVNFTSDDRSALQGNGGFKKVRFSTPVNGYRAVDGRRVIESGHAVFHYPEGDFAYGGFTLKQVSYNLSRPNSA